MTLADQRTPRADLQFHPEDREKHRAWGLAAQIQGEDPAMVRLARGYRLEWDAYGHYDSQVGWTVLNGEVRSFMDLRGC
jgi:hypothetical protein